MRLKLSTYHLEYDGVRVAVGHETRERPSAGHPEPAAVVEHDDVCAGFVDELGGEADACACAEDDSARGDGLSEAGEGLFSVGWRCHIKNGTMQGSADGECGYRCFEPTMKLSPRTSHAVRVQAETCMWLYE